jgi:hypothetical protein
MERFDLLHRIHKAFRHAILTFNIASGRADYADLTAVAGVVKEWSQLRENLARHAKHEDELIFPLLSARTSCEPREPFGWQTEVDALHEDHMRIAGFELEMNRLLRSIESASDDMMRRRLGREFHRSVQRFTAMCLLHFDDEERRFMPRIWSLYDDADLIRTFERVMETLGLEERGYAMAHMVEALDPVELQEVQQELRAAS